MIMIHRKWQKRLENVAQVLRPKHKSGDNAVAAIVALGAIIAVGFVAVVIDIIIIIVVVVVVKINDSAETILMNLSFNTKIIESNSHLEILQHFSNAKRFVQLRKWCKT